MPDTTIINIFKKYYYSFKTNKYQPIFNVSILYIKI